MTQERLTMRETCELLGVSRAMVQKLEASGELKAIREDGRVFFERAQVEELKDAREIARIQREQEQEQREFLGEQAEERQQNLEFDARSKTFNERREHQITREALEAVSAQLRRMQDSEHVRRIEASLEALSARSESRSSADSELLNVLMLLAPVGALLLGAHLLRPKGEGAGADPLGPVPDRAEDGMSVPNAEETARAIEATIVEKLSRGAADESDVRALARLMWMRAHPTAPK